MKRLKKLLPMVLVFIMLLSTNLTAFASSADLPQFATVSGESSVIIPTQKGVYINGEYYTKKQFVKLLEKANEINMPQTRMAELVAGTWWIPGVGEVVITVAGVIVIGGVVITAGSWIYDVVSNWFAQKAEIKAVKKDIPERLKDGSGEVDLGKFGQKVKNKTAYKEKGGWTIEKDTAGHGGRKWKLKDKSGKRVASLDENGKVLGK